MGCSRNRGYVHDFMDMDKNVLSQTCRTISANCFTQTLVHKWDLLYADK